MNAPILVRALRDHRRSVIGWAVGVFLYLALIVAVWPSIRDSNQLTTAFQDYPDALKKLFGGEASFDFTTAAGFLNAELFSLMLPLLLSVFSIGFAASTLAGEEERGLLDLVLAHPVRRKQVVTQKAVAIGLGLLVLAGVATVTLIGLGEAVGLDAGATNLIAALTGSTLVAAVVGYLTLFVGAWRGSRAAAIGAGAAGFGAAYLVQVVASFVASLEPVHWISPMYLANGSVPVRDGWPWLRFAVLGLAAVVLVLASRAAFERRDLAG